jgi:THO complex subunit 1
MPASKGKALPLLRSINAFLRFLPRTPEDLVFRGRVHQFASSVISIADKSAINLRGDYNEIKTIWEEAEAEGSGSGSAAEVKEDDGDVEMEGSGSLATSKGGREAETKDGKDADTKPEADFYSTLWSLQQYFAHPPSLAPSTTTPVSTPRTPASASEPAATPFASFRQKSEIVLPILFEQTKKQKELMGREVEGSTKKRKRNEAGLESEIVGDFFYPRYLTGKKLLEHEVSFNPIPKASVRLTTSWPTLRSAARFSFNTLSSFSSYSTSPPVRLPNRRSLAVCPRISSLKPVMSPGSGKGSL